MTKQETIQEIKNLLSTYGCFSVGELDNLNTQSPCIASMGSVVGLAEYFTQDYAEINVYQTASYSSDPIETYDELYHHLSEDVLHEILQLCQEFEAQSIRDEKIINN